MLGLAFAPTAGMKDIKLLPKLLAGFVLVAIIVVGVGYFGVTGSERLSGQLQTVGTVVLPSAIGVLRLDTARGSQSAMEQIRATSQTVREMIAALSTSMSEQVAAVQELSKALENVDEMSQSISAATEQQSTNAM